MAELFLLENFLKDKTEALSRIEKLAFLSVHITRNHKSEISNLREVISSDIIEISKLREITKKLNNDKEKLKVELKCINNTNKELRNKLLSIQLGIDDNSTYDDINDEYKGKNQLLIANNMEEIKKIMVRCTEKIPIK